MSFEQRYLRIVSGAARGPFASAARAGLALLEPGYAATVALRNASFDRGWRRIVGLPRPVLSVGNLTVGGTGKTPLVAWLCERFLAGGVSPAVLMRGYKARPGDKGDEQRLLETLLGAQVPVEADPDRSAAARRVLARRDDVRLFVLDDAFQHRRVRRDADIVLIDATRAFGYDHLLPRGLLREPPSSLVRATAVVLTRTDLASGESLAALRAQVARHTAAPIVECHFNPEVTDALGRPLHEFAGSRALAVCGIGNPHAFIASLRRLGVEIAGQILYSDHHHYTSADVTRIARAANDAGAAVLTTAKDWVKLEELWPRDAATTPCVVRQRVAFPPGDEQRLMQVLEARLQR